MALHRHAIPWGPTYVADPDPAHDGEDAAGTPTRVVDAWEVSSEGVAYYPVLVTSALWEQARCEPVPALVRAVVEAQAVSYWRGHAGQWPWLAADASRSASSAGLFRSRDAGAATTWVQRTQANPSTCVLLSDRPKRGLGWPPPSLPRRSRD